MEDYLAVDLGVGAGGDGGADGVGGWEEGRDEGD